MGKNKLVTRAGLTAKQEKFIDLCANNIEGKTLARMYIEAGYKPSANPRYTTTRAYELKQSLLEEIRFRKKLIHRQADIHQAKILMEEKYIAHSDLTNYINKNGNFMSCKELKDLPKHMRHALQKLKISRKIDKKTGEIIEEIEVGVFDKGKSLERLQKCEGMHEQKVNVHVQFEEVMKLVGSLPMDQQREFVVKLREKAQNGNYDPGTLDITQFTQIQEDLSENSEK